MTVTGTERADALVADAGELWRPNPGPQEEFLSRCEFEIGYGGAKGGGKSEGILWGATRQLHHPRYHAIIFRRTYVELQELMDRALEKFPRLEGRWSGQQKRWRFPTGARLSFSYCEDQGDEDRHLGREYQYVGFDQAEGMTELQYTKLLSCARTSAEGLTVMARATFNPGGPGHLFVKKRFVDLGPRNPIQDPETGLSRVFIPASVYDNPILMRNDPGYIARLMSIADPALRRAMLEGDFNVFAGQYFEEWRDAVHVVEVREQIAPPATWGRAGGMDWGFSPGLGVVLWAGFDVHQRAWLYKELVFHEEPPLAVAKLIEEKCTDDAERSMLIRADTQMWEKEPASRRGDSIALEINRALHNAGLQVTLIPAKKDRANGWARVHQYLDPRRPRPDGKGTGPYLRVYRANPQTGLGCPYTIETLPAQTHDVRAGKEWDLRKSETDHACDALRYLLMAQPALGALPLPHEVRGPHHQMVGERVRALLLGGLERAQQEAEGPLPQTAGRLPTVHEGDEDAETVADVYG